MLFRSLPLQGHTNDITYIKRHPDGVFLNWKERVFHILKFTRTYDSTIDDLLCTDEVEEVPTYAQQDHGKTAAALVERRGYCSLYRSARHSIRGSLANSP